MEFVLVGLLGLALGAGGCALSMSGRRAAEPPPLAETQLSTQLVGAVDLLRGAAMVVDSADQVLHATAAALTTGLVRGNRIREPELLGLVRRVRAGGVPVSTKLTVQGTSMVSRDLAVRAAPLDGGLLLVIAEDLSAQTRADEIKRDFTANVSHELKTPVGALKVLAEAVEQAADDPEAVSHFAHRMTLEADRLSELVQQIIELSRLQSTDPLMHSERVEIDRVVDDACDRNAALASSRDVTITRTGTAGLQVMGDEEQLTGALSNLIQNAINYSGTAAKVSVSVRDVVDDDDEFVEISVADNGLGIRPEDLERIFERFYRVDFARSRETGGTGLGLSIVKHCMAAHGGTVNVWSKFGEGSTFTLRLPIFQADAISE